MPDHKSVVYLIGAGASHGSVKAVGCSRGILMEDLRQPLAEAVRDLVTRKPRKYGAFRGLVNEIIHDKVDVEHIITFFHESPSAIHQEFAEELRHVFQKVLKRELRAIAQDHRHERFGLFAALLDMYSVRGCPEILGGILSINYDEYVEAAARAVYRTGVDYGLTIRDVKSSEQSLRLLKLHGSFDWKDVWPVEIQPRSANPLWIPPGIRKAKGRYPFNVLWGLAREMLNCDVLRIIGCSLSGNDWDLISLLFSTRKAQSNRVAPYVIEVIDSPSRAFQFQQQYPYLEARSLFELENQEISENFVSELLGGDPRSFDRLSDEDKKMARTQDYRGYNWFSIWLQQMAVALEQDLTIASTKTKSGHFQRLLQVS